MRIALLKHLLNTSHPISLPVNPFLFLSYFCSPPFLLLILFPSLSISFSSPNSVPLLFLLLFPHFTEHVLHNVHTLRDPPFYDSRNLCINYPFPRPQPIPQKHLPVSNGQARYVASCQSCTCLLDLSFSLTHTLAPSRLHLILLFPSRLPPIHPPFPDPF